MTARKRKQPEKAKKVARGGLVLRGLQFGGRFAARHPVPFIGTMSFAVAFSFVAANAMWYQHGPHPSPLMRTRVAFSAPETTAVEASEAGKGLAEPRKVTTFVIEREDDPAAGSEETAMREAAAPAEDIAWSTGDDGAPVAGERGTGSIDAGQKAVSVRPPVLDADSDVPSIELVSAVQNELSRLGLYDGAADGKIGRKTTAAILAYERKVRLAETGRATPQLLSMLRHATPGAAPTGRAIVTPVERPLQTGSTTEGDPVALAIRSAEDGGTKPASDATLVMGIQQGLANLAYDGIVVDGVAGDQTRAAIRRFEKHYSLPSTGEPNQKVLAKLKAIGAL